MHNLGRSHIVCSPVDAQRILGTNIFMYLNSFRWFDVLTDHKPTGFITTDRNGGESERSVKMANCFKFWTIAGITSEIETLVLALNSPTAPQTLKVMILHSQQSKPKENL